MRINTLIALGAATALATGQAALAADQGMSAGEPTPARVNTATFDELDRNHDNRVDRQEAPEPLANRIGDLDTDGSGDLSQAEFAIFEPLAESGGPAEYPRQIYPDSVRILGQSFQELDEDRSAVLERAELPAALLEHWEALDLDQSGNIAESEFAAFTHSELVDIRPE